MPAQGHSTPLLLFRRSRLGSRPGVLVVVPVVASVGFVRRGLRGDRVLGLEVVLHDMTAVETDGLKNNRVQAKGEVGKVVGDSARLDEERVDLLVDLRAPRRLRVCEGSFLNYFSYQVSFLKGFASEAR